MAEFFLQLAFGLFSAQLPDVGHGYHVKVHGFVVR
jgi:hypothetical protein